MINKSVVMQTIKCNPDQYPQTLGDRFPHILEKIVLLWNSPEADAYFADLLQPNGRGGGRMDRDGFPETAWQEILHLRLLYTKSRQKLEP